MTDRLNNRVELGAGGGLVGLAVARGCQTDKPIYITDQEPMMQLMQDNISLNDLSTKVKPALLDWGVPPPAEIPKHPEIVLAADCVYFEPAFPLLISTLQTLLGPDTICYFCFKRRRRADLRCIKMIKKVLKKKEREGRGRSARVMRCSVPGLALLLLLLLGRILLCFALLRYAMLGSLD